MNLYLLGGKSGHVMWCLAGIVSGREHMLTAGEGAVPSSCSRCPNVAHNIVWTQAADAIQVNKQTKI